MVFQLLYLLLEDFELYVSRGIVAVEVEAALTDGHTAGLPREVLEALHRRRPPRLRVVRMDT